MHHHYSDIISRISDPPLWWDENAVPRYDEFTPDGAANIYAMRVCLLLIECQDCGHPYKVCMSESSMDQIYESIAHPSLIKAAEKGWLHYGDPPNACPPGCCAGSTMNSVPRRVLEFWRKGDWDENRMAWVRMPELEGKDITPGWAKDAEQQT